MKNTIEQEMQRVLANLDAQDEQEQGPDIETPEEKEPEAPIPGQDETQEIQDIYVLVVREKAEPEEPLAGVVEATPTPKDANSRKPLDTPAIFASIFLACLLLSFIALQIFLALNPPIATITIIPKSQQISLRAVLQLGRLLPSLTISQEATTSTSGQKHQQARQARGAITFYNGQFQAITVPAGTILSGSSGVQIATDQEADIPPGNPPTYGQKAVSAHAINPGIKGNIPAYDISQACCASAVLVKNTTPFYNGQDERDYKAVAGRDIDLLSASLKTTLAQSMQGALQGLVKPNEELHLLPCSPGVTADHQIGQEAAAVKVTVSETCSGVAYNQKVLQNLATDLLSQQAAKKLGSGYSLLGTVNMTIIQAAVSHMSPTLAFSCQGMWVYMLSHTAQEHLKHLIAGKRKDQAISVLSHAPGIQTASIAGVDDNQSLPKNPSFIIFHSFAGGE